MMMATVCWRSTTRYLQLQRWSSSSSSSTAPTLLSLCRCSESTRIKSRALSSSLGARTAADNDDLNNNAAKEDGQQTLDDHNQTASTLQKKKPTIVRPPRASNAPSFHRGVKLTPAAAAQNHQQDQHHEQPNAAAPPRATLAAPRSFVRIKPVTQTAVTSNNNNKSTAVASGGGANFIESSPPPSSLLLRQNQRRHQKAQQQQQEPPQQPYRRHGKNSNRQHTNVNTANSSSFSPTATVPVPTTSCWVQVDGISPLSSLDAILATVQTALEQQQQQQQASGGITLDLDRDTNNDCSPWFVERARVILSPFARPMGWLLKFRNPSIVEALLTHAQNHPIRSGWKMVSIKEFNQEDDNNDKDNTELVVTDATLRIENCSHDTTMYDLMNMFARFDLAVRGSLSSSSSSSSTVGPSVQEWKGTLPNGRLAPPGTFLVHFADASWARAALREKQGMVFKDRQLRLAQYPRQII